jgi:hypothetical protein
VKMLSSDWAGTSSRVRQHRVWSGLVGFGDLCLFLGRINLTSELSAVLRSTALQFRGIASVTVRRHNVRIPTKGRKRETITCLAELMDVHVK